MLGGPTRPRPVQIESGVYLGHGRYRAAVKSGATLAVTVPRGISAGDHITVENPSGGTMHVTCPPYSSPGMVLHIQHNNGRVTGVLVRGANTGRALESYTPNMSENSDILSVLESNTPQEQDRTRPTAPPNAETLKRLQVTPSAWFLTSRL